jgi:hypothetical protein
MPALEHVNVEAMDPLRFESMLSVGEFEALRYLIADAARGLDGRVIWNVNSTANGGGVAEMLPWPRRRRPMGGHLRGPRVLPDHQAHSQSPARLRRRRWSVGRRRA